MIKKQMIRSFLEDSFCGESKAHMKYTIFAENAEKKGLKNLSRLWKAIAYAEYVHAKNHFIALGNLKSVEENLTDSLDGENFEVEEMYPVYNNTAEFQNEPEAKRTTHYAIEAEKIHAKMYKNALEKIKTSKDIEENKIFICEVCGYTTFDNAPEKCPVCGANKEKFKEFI